MTIKRPERKHLKKINRPWYMTTLIKYKREILDLEKQNEELRLQLSKAHRMTRSTISCYIKEALSNIRLREELKKYSPESPISTDSDEKD